MKAFQIKVNGKYLDYRIGQKVDLDEFSTFLIEFKDFVLEL